jgi:hypothetical protein
MQLLKNKKKSEAYTALLNKLKGVVELKNMGLIKIDFNTNSFFLFPELWQMFDKPKKLNWCKNIFIYAELFKRDYPKFQPDKALNFYDINSEKLMATYHKGDLTLPD